MSAGAAACTIVARNYLAHARVLAESFARHNPDAGFSVLIIDDEAQTAGAAGLSCRTLRLKEIGFEREEIEILAAIYDVTELSTAVKPRLLQFLLDEGSASAVYLDPDIKVFAPLDVCFKPALTHAIVLTPHTMQPLPVDGLRIGAAQILASGIYNLGFVSVGRSAEPFLSWWWDRIERDALSEPAQMMFTDQRVVDFAPSLFDACILKDSSCNVAYWNLHGRRFDKGPSGYEVDGRPLTFFHFSGFDHRNPYLLSKHQLDRPRILLSENAALAELCREYLDDLRRHGVFTQPTLAYGWKTFGNGYELTPRMRRFYRQAVVDAEAVGEAVPPGPFSDPPGQAFLGWLNEPVKLGPRAVIGRYLLHLHEQRSDLSAHFTDLAGSAAAVYLDWVCRDGVSQEHLPLPLVPSHLAIEAAGQSPYAVPGQLTEGLNLIGYFQAELGVGEAARLLRSASEGACLSSDVLVYERTFSRQQHGFVGAGSGSAPHDVNVLCINADMTPHAAREFGPEFFAGRHTAGLWFWEVEAFPATMMPAFEYVDEVWAATRFVAEALRRVAPKPVFEMPLPVLPPPVASVGRQQLGVPDGFIFLFVFDFFSVFERKNPLGLVEAFTRAFKPGEGPTLILKGINGSRSRVDRERLLFAQQGRPDILLMEEYLSPAEKNSLIAACDCYVSLHRSEGLGLTMAEAMALGKPVIATGYSGNLHFMNEENSYLVPTSPGVIPSHCQPYPAGTAWAEPDLDRAAEHMRRVFEAPAEAAALGKRARQQILQQHSPEVCGQVLRGRVDEIRSARRERVRLASAEPGTAASRDSGFEATLAAADAALTPATGSAPSVLRPLRTGLQSVLFRVLRPLWWQQRHAQHLVVQGIRELHASLSHELQGRFKSVDSVVSVHTLRLAQLSADTEEARQRRQNEDVQHRQKEERQRRHEEETAAKMTAVVERLEQTQAAFETEVERRLRDTASSADQVKVRERLDSIEAAARSLERAVADFHLAAAPQLADLSSVAGRTETELATLSARLYAPPYMANPELLLQLDNNGHHRLGFATPSDAGIHSTYLEFEKVFRGPTPFIRERLSRYLPLIGDRAPVLDAGCGRGEMLELLRARGIAAEGVDCDPAMVEHCRTRGLHVSRADVIEDLQMRAAGSLGTIFAAQLIEHLSYEQLLDFLRLATAKLVSGGLLIAETVNPHAIEAFKTFWTDLTHQRPIFPEVALTLCRAHGFAEGYVLFPHGTGELEIDRRTQGEYAVVATTAGR